MEKKITTYELRKNCRKEMAQKRIQERQTITEARTSDKTLFYRIIRQQRGKLTRFIDELYVGNQTHNTEDQILEGWKSHFEQLAERSICENYDKDYLHLAEAEYQTIIQSCKERAVHVPMTKQEVKKAINSLNRNKAADFYGITAENIVYGGDNLVKYIQEVLNKTFQLHHIPDILKIGILFPVFKNKGDCKNAKNYRGITVTPTLSKIIEKILKIRENGKILLNQNPLQKGFTENSSPLLCELLVEEFERENKDLKRPTYIAMLDAKSAFDVVVHANLIRRLHQYEFSDQSIVLINSLYENAVSHIKWKNLMSEQNFKIEQGVRQSGVLSADLYKLYINPLLNFLDDSGLGGKIGNINVCAPTCADDVALIAYNPLDIQTMVDIAVDFSKREGYQLQPAKSVILPVKSKIKTIVTNEGFWKIDNRIMPVVDKATHIGITRSDTNSARTTVDENIRKARRATYSLMGTGLHGENGLDPETSISLLKTYILPILTYGLEIVIPKGKILDDIQNYYKKLLKQLLSLTINVSDPAVYMISGLLPLEAEIHTKVFTMFGNITRAHKNSTEWKLAERQLHIKSLDSNSWFMEIKKLCIKYDLEDPIHYMQNHLSKTKWKSLITSAIYNYWSDRINEEIKYYSTLKYLSPTYEIGKIHPLAKTNTVNQKDINRIPTRLKLATGNYMLQTMRAAYNQNPIDPTCKLCNQAEETVSHFLICCKTLEYLRAPTINNIIEESSKLFASHCTNPQLDIIQLIINPFHYAVNNSLKANTCTSIEPLCRQLIYKLHCKRYELLAKNDLLRCKRKINISA